MLDFDSFIETYRPDLRSYTFPPSWTPPAGSDSLRTISLKSKRSLRSSFVITGPAPRIMHVESDLEKKHALVLLADPEIVELREQVDPVTYVDRHGKLTSHIFDFHARFKDGSKVAFAVRPFQIAERQNFKAELDLIAAQVSVEFADSIAMLTERDLTRDLVHDAKLIHSVRRDPPSASDVVVKQLVASLDEPIGVGALVERSRLGSVGFRAIVRLIAAGVLTRAGNGRIGNLLLVAPSRLWSAA